MKIVTPTTRRSNQAGYTLLMVVFMVATMLLVAATATPNILTQGRREKEAELIWRGQQYQRAIGLYFRKFGKYPTKVEDLTKQTNGVRFLRKAYTDPMNKDDGSWRFIYVGPNGQLIGSLRQTSLLQSALSTPGAGALSALGGGMQPLSPPGPGTATGANQTPGAGQPGAGTTANPLESQPQPLDGTIVGGNIIGVGSKMKQPSFRVYLGGDTYEQWEFIWNPTGLIALPGQGPLNPNGTPTGIPGGSPGVVNPNGTNPNGPNPGGITPNPMNPNGPAGQPPQQNPQAPVVNVQPAQ
jgi:type II secretory pathway pseudopilin PulG